MGPFPLAISICLDTFTSLTTLSGLMAFCSIAFFMLSSWEKLVKYVGTNYGPDIGNEFQNKKTYVIAEPEHAPATLA